jgi:hypothetical protein
MRDAVSVLNEKNYVLNATIRKRRDGNEKALWKLPESEN